MVKKKSFKLNPVKKPFLSILKKLGLIPRIPVEVGYAVLARQRLMKARLQ